MEQSSNPKQYFASIQEEVDKFTKNMQYGYSESFGWSDEAKAIQTKFETFVTQLHQVQQNLDKCSELFESKDAEDLQSKLDSLFKFEKKWTAFEKKKKLSNKSKKRDTFSDNLDNLLGAIENIQQEVNKCVARAEQQEKDRLAEIKEEKRLATAQKHLEAKRLKEEALNKELVTCKGDALKAETDLLALVQEKLLNDGDLQIEPLEGYPTADITLEKAIEYITYYKAYLANAIDIRHNLVNLKKDRAKAQKIVQRAWKRLETKIKINKKILPHITYDIQAARPLLKERYNHLLERPIVEAPLATAKEFEQAIDQCMDDMCRALHSYTKHQINEYHILLHHLKGKQIADNGQKELMRIIVNKENRKRFVEAIDECEKRMKPLESQLKEFHKKNKKTLAIVNVAKYVRQIISYLDMAEANIDALSPAAQSYLDNVEGYSDNFEPLMANLKDLLAQWDDLKDQLSSSTDSEDTILQTLNTYKASIEIPHQALISIYNKTKNITELQLQYLENLGKIQHDSELWNTIKTHSLSIPKEELANWVTEQINRWRRPSLKTWIKRVLNIDSVSGGKLRIVSLGNYAGKPIHMTIYTSNIELTKTIDDSMEDIRDELLPLGEGPIGLHTTWEYFGQKDNRNPHYFRNTTFKLNNAPCDQRVEIEKELKTRLDNQMKQYEQALTNFIQKRKDAIL